MKIIIRFHTNHRFKLKCNLWLECCLKYIESANCFIF